MKRKKVSSIEDIPASTRRRIANRIINDGGIIGLSVEGTGVMRTEEHGPNAPQVNDPNVEHSGLVEVYHDPSGIEHNREGTFAAVSQSASASCGSTAPESASNYTMDITGGPAAAASGAPSSSQEPAIDVTGGPAAAAASGAPSSSQEPAINVTGEVWGRTVPNSIVVAEQAAFGLPVVIPPQYPAEDFPNDPTHGVVHGECAPAADEGVPEGVNDNPLIPGVLPVIEGLPDVDSPEPSECGDDGPEENSDDEEDEAPPVQGNPQENHEPEAQQDLPLYNGAPISLGQSMIAILTFALVHSLSGSCLVDLLVLLNLHCMTPNLCKTSLYLFKKYFEGIKSPVRIRLFCSLCFEECEKQGCGACGPESSICYLVELPIISQLRKMFKKDGFYEKLNHRFTRRKLKEHGIEDLYDGFLYKQYFGPNGLLRDRRNISFTWYTDGAQVFKSSKVSIWPLFLSINELPYRDRLLKENVIMSALWCGPVKPPANLLLGTLLEEMGTLAQGVEMEVPDVGNVPVRAMVLCGTCDSPARAMCLNIHTHSGFYSCSRCLIAGAKIDKTMVFPYYPYVPPRTHENLQADGEVAKDLPPDDSIRGVKGPTVLTNLVPNVPRSTGLDIMHCLYSGCFKKLLKLWFDPNFSHLPWSRSTMVGVVDQMIRNLKLPGCISRQPRDIKHHLAYFKAKEFRNMFHIFALPVFESVLGAEYFQHFLLLVTGISLLTSESVAFDDIEQSRQLLHEFVRQFPVLYNIKYLTLNFHLLLHLPDQVLDLGPLQKMACFGYEGLNGEILQLVHGTRYVHSQISTAISVSLQLPILVKNLDEMSPAKMYCIQLLTKGKRVKYGGRVAEGIFFAGKCFLLPQMPYDICESLRAAEVQLKEIKYFRRLQKRNLLFHSQEYRRSVKTNSTCALFEFDGHMHIGIIRIFVQGKNCACVALCEWEHSAFVLARKLNIVRTFQTAGPTVVTLTSCLEVEYSNELLCFNPSGLKRLCSFMQVRNKIFVSIPSLSFDYD